MQNIDITVILDAISLQELHPDCSQDSLAPTAVAQDAICMVAAPQRHVLRGHASDTLELTAESGDTLRWHMDAAAGSRCHAILYEIALLHAPDSATDDENLRKAVTTVPAMKVAPYPSPVPDVAEPTRYAESQRIDVHWHCTVEKPGRQRYRLLFYVVEQDDGGTLNTVGYYSWETTLVVFPYPCSSPEATG